MIIRFCPKLTNSQLYCGESPSLGLAYEQSKSFLHCLLFAGEMGYATVLFTKYFSRSIASFTVCAFVISCVPAYAQSDFSKTSISFQAETISSQNDQPILLAHCGACELGPVQLLEETSGSSKLKGVVSESLWGNLILNMAYQRDKELQKLVKRQSLANLLTLGAVAGVSGLAIAQNVTTLSTLGGAAHAHADGGGDEGASSGGHDEGHSDSPAPGIIGLVASGTTIGALLGQIYINHRYKKKVKARQMFIRQQVDEILGQLDSGLEEGDTQQKLVQLIGKRATREFMQLWQSSHVIAGKPSIQG